MNNHLEIRVPGRHLNSRDARTIAHGMRATLNRDAQAIGFDRHVPYLEDYIDALLRYADELEAAIITDAMRELEEL